MGADNPTKEEKEFCESIMKEIKTHQDFGKRNPVDIGIECGYSKDDVMGMIYMCQDIIASNQSEIPVRKKWDLEGIIPFEDFMKIDFPKEWESDDDEIDYQWVCACEVSNIAFTEIWIAIRYAPKMRKKSLKKITDNNEHIIWSVQYGFSELTKWAALYGYVLSMVLGKSDTCNVFASKEQIKAIKQLIKKERKIGKIHPVDMMIIKLNGWEDDLKGAIDDTARSEIRKQITSQFEDLTNSLVANSQTEEEKGNFGLSGTEKVCIERLLETD